MRNRAKNYYQILGLSRHASPEQIRKAYLNYASKFHPDKHSGDVFFEEYFKEIAEAYDLLNDSEKRRQYDIRKFGKSSAMITVQPSSSEKTTKKKFKLQITHVDIYVSAFYFFNLTSWVIVRHISNDGHSGNYLWSLILSTLSSMFLWLFVNGLIGRAHQRSTFAALLRMGYFVLSLMLAIATIMISEPKFRV